MLIIGLPGKTLTDEDRRWLATPQVSGVILFTRNFESRDQVTALIDDLRVARPDPFLVCVDQEGGPVQRFRPGFTRLPALARIGDLARGNLAIGERAFAADPETVSELTQAYLRGMRLAGMAATLKHFPGHGSVAEDTHFDAAID